MGSAAAVCCCFPLAVSACFHKVQSPWLPGLLLLSSHHCLSRAFTALLCLSASLSTRWVFDLCPYSSQPIWPYFISLFWPFFPLAIFSPTARYVALFIPTSFLMADSILFHFFAHFSITYFVFWPHYPPWLSLESGMSSIALRSIPITHLPSLSSLLLYFRPTISLFCPFFAPSFSPFGVPFFCHLFRHLVSLPLYQSVSYHWLWPSLPHFSGFIHQKFAFLCYFFFLL